jgi:hypothetical protein
VEPRPSHWTNLPGCALGRDRTCDLQRVELASFPLTTSANPNWWLVRVLISPGRTYEMQLRAGARAVVPTEGFKPPSTSFEARSPVQLDHAGRIVQPAGFEPARLVLGGRAGVQVPRLHGVPGRSRTFSCLLRKPAARSAGRDILARPTGVEPAHVGLEGQLASKSPGACCSSPCRNRTGSVSSKS